MLARGKIAAIQFEFNEMNVTGRTFLSDFMNYLGNTFTFYRILPHGLLKLVPGNHWHNEQFGYQNLLAVRMQVSPDR
jgi:hypothetical protein